MCVQSLNDVVCYLFELTLFTVVIFKLYDLRYSFMFDKFRKLIRTLVNNCNRFRKMIFYWRMDNDGEKIHLSPF